MVDQPQSRPDDSDAPPVAKCPHHWLIERPDRETSVGVCKYCGAVRSFSNEQFRRPMTMRRSESSGGGSAQPAPPDPGNESV